MASGFIVRPLAEADLDDAARWYEAERAGLAARFLSDVDQTFTRIAERPRLVLAVLHLRRNPKVWRGRIR
jgi:plasmid stabilization system protein ParE